MTDSYHARVVRRAWKTVFLVVLVIVVLASSLLWVYGFPVFLVGAASGLLFTVFAFLVQLGYYVKMPEKRDLTSAKGRQDLAWLADYLCLDSSGDSAELRRSITEFIDANSGRSHVWVAPPRLLAGLRRARLLTSGPGDQASSRPVRKATERVKNGGL